jgi:xanthine/CO dehydrogenase XdhC/CoxF family maturation factor
VKHWHETAAILDRVARLAEAGERAAIATVVRISGSAYRRPGAKFLVERDGKTSGGVSGGCLEADVREVALQLLRQGPPRLLHYDTGSDDDTVWGLGLGCEGAVDIFVQPVGAEFIRGPGARVRERLAGGTAFGVAAPFAIATVVKGRSSARSKSSRTRCPMRAGWKSVARTPSSSTSSRRLRCCSSSAPVTTRGRSPPWPPRRASK